MPQYPLFSPRLSLLALTLGGLGALTGCPGRMPTTADGGGGSSSASTGTAGGVMCSGANNTDLLWANWPMPNPVGTGLRNQASYTVDSQGITVKDNITGLVWEHNSSVRTLAAAEDHCKTFKLNGVGGFRMPTRIELVSLLDYTRANPAIDTATFSVSSITIQGVPDPLYYYWTSQPTPMDPGFQVIVDFGLGTSPTWGNGGVASVRCVRGPEP